MSNSMHINVKHVTRIEGHGNILVNATDGKLLQRMASPHFCTGGSVSRASIVRPLDPRQNPPTGSCNKSGRSSPEQYRCTTPSLRAPTPCLTAASSATLPDTAEPGGPC